MLQLFSGKQKFIRHQASFEVFTQIYFIVKYTHSVPKITQLPNISFFGPKFLTH